MHREDDCPCHTCTCRCHEDGSGFDVTPTSVLREAWSNGLFHPEVEEYITSLVLAGLPDWRDPDGELKRIRRSREDKLAPREVPIAKQVADCILGYRNER